MMDCASYRRAMLAEPHGDSPELRAHAVSCAECAAYVARLRLFESRLELALRVAAIADSSAGAPSLTSHAGRRRDARPRRRRRWLAVAASGLLGAVVAGALWLSATDSSLAADVVGHMAGEPQAWARTDAAVPRSQLDKILDEAHVRLRGDPGLVSYASSCDFRGHRVPHLVVQTGSGPVTVMVLTHESVKRGMHFDEQNYRGMIVPVPGHGSLAVLERGGSPTIAALPAIAAQVQGAIEWLP